MADDGWKVVNENYYKWEGPERKSSSNTKVSVGIIVCRINENTGEITVSDTSTHMKYEQLFIDLGISVIIGTIYGNNIPLYSRACAICPLACLWSFDACGS